jgi:hypothetical protein
MILSATLQNLFFRDRNEWFARGWFAVFDLWTWGLVFPCYYHMTRGNQRELARQKNQKKQQSKTKTKDDGLTPQQRRERDAAALQAKIQKKQETAT